MKLMTRGFSAAVIALSAALGLSLTGAHRSIAAPEQVQAQDNGPHIRLLSPTTRATFQGAKPIEIDALYEGAPGNGIVDISLYIDGVKAQSQALKSPESKGMVSFLVDASLMSPGPHYVVVRATAADAEVRSVRGSFIYQSGSIDNNISVPGGSADQNELNWPSSPGDAPEMRLMYPAPNSTVQGKVTIQVDANDANGKPPYVSIFVDGQMKQLVNYRPFEYEWDTTPLPNGWHTITVVEAFDSDSTPVAHLKPIKIYVNNPGGQTYIRHDLLDAPQIVKPAMTRPLAPAASPSLTPHKAAISHKTLASRPLARRPQGEAALANSPQSSTLSELGRPTRIAALDPRWDGPESNLLPALSDPTIVNLPAAAPSPAPVKHTLQMPTTGFKPVAPGTKLQSLTPHGAPVTAAAPRGKHGTVVAKGLRTPMLMAESGLLDEPLASPILSLPLLPAESPTVAVVVPHSIIKHTVKPMTAPSSAPILHLKVHVSAPSEHAQTTIKPHFSMGGSSLLRVVGEKQLRFNHTSIALERPLAIRQNILFGPLRRIFEYGGAHLQWNAHGGVVSAETAHKDIRLHIGSHTASINNRPFTMNGVPYINNGRTMVPLSFVGVAMNADVQYDPATGHLKITSRP